MVEGTSTGITLSKGGAGLVLLIIAVVLMFLAAFGVKLGGVDLFDASWAFVFLSFIF